MKSTDASVVIETKDIEDFVQEAGGHRIQRVPPTEKRGRVHTSTVTVAVLFPTHTESVFDKRSDDDFDMKFFSGTGKGGQHRNVHCNSVRMTHLPTGFTQTAVSRSKDSNIRDARMRLEEMLDREKHSSGHSAQNDIRSAQIGCAMRGDKRRTYRFQDDQVVDQNGLRTTCKSFMKGDIEKLWR